MNIRPFAAGVAVGMALLAGSTASAQTPVKKPAAGKKAAPDSREPVDTQIWGASLSPDGKTLVTVGNSGKLSLWDVATGKRRTWLKCEPDKATSPVEFSPDGKIIGAKDSDKIVGIMLFDAATGKRLRNIPVDFRRKGFGIESFHFLPDGKSIYTIHAPVAEGGGYTKTELKVWNVATGTERFTLAGDDRRAAGFQVSPDGKVGAGGGENGDITLWDMAAGTEMVRLRGHIACVDSLNFSPDGKTMVTYGRERTYRVWDLTDFSEKAKFTPEEPKPFGATFSPDRKLMVTQGEGGLLRLWETEGWTCRFPLYGPKTPVHFLGFSPDSKTLTVFQQFGGRGYETKYTGTVRLLDVATGREVSIVRGLAETDMVRFLPDMTTFTAMEPEGLAIWDLKTATKLTVVTGVKGHQLPFAFLTPNGETLILGGPEATVRFLKVRDLLKSAGK